MWDLLRGRFLDVRNMGADYKQKCREMFSPPAEYQAQLFDGDGPCKDTSFLGAWPLSVSKTYDLIEMSCFMCMGHDDNSIKIGIKASKTAQEILEQYQPWKTTIEDIDAAILNESSVLKVADGNS